MNRLFLLLFGMVTFVAHAQVPDYVPTEGLVAWYPINGNANDESGNGNDGIAVSVETTHDRFGNENAAYYFSGSGCTPRIDIDMNTSEITDEITISIWFNRQGNGCIGPRLFEAKPPSGDQGLGHMIIAWDNGWSHPQQWNHNLNASSGTAYDVFLSADSVNDVPNDSWGMLLYRNDGTSASYFQDGVLIAEMQNPENSTIHLPGDIAIGRMNHPSYDAFNGFIDDVGFWSRALTNEEIIALYNAELSVPGCTESTACNYNEHANEDDGTCTYPPFGLTDCESGGALCGEGTIWDASLQACVGFNDCPSDLDGDGIVGVNDLLSLLSDFGTECPPEVAEWTCGDPVSYHSYDYSTVQIGDQCWLAENLRNAHYANGDVIPGQSSSAEWSSTTEGAQAVYDNETDNMNTYGLLYNWYAVSDARGLCPTDWHVPTDGEWMTLEISLGMSETEADSIGWRGTDQGTQIKASPSDTPSWDGTNASGFFALAGGNRDGAGNSVNEGVLGNFWSNSPGGTGAWYRKPRSGDTKVFRHYTYRQNGLSVRCLKD